MLEQELGAIMLFAGLFGGCWNNSILRKISKKHWPRGSRKAAEVRTYLKGKIGGTLKLSKHIWTEGNKEKSRMTPGFLAQINERS